MILLNDIQRQTLRDLSDASEGKNYTQENKPLEFFLRGLREQYPECFNITPVDLRARVFVDTPLSVPQSMYKRAVLTMANSSRNKAAA
jgi:hypothetical protein